MSTHDRCKWLEINLMDEIESVEMILMKLEVQRSTTVIRPQKYSVVIRIWLK